MADRRYSRGLKSMIAGWLLVAGGSLALLLSDAPGWAKLFVPLGLGFYLMLEGQARFHHDGRARRIGGQHG